MWFKKKRDIIKELAEDKTVSRCECDSNCSSCKKSPAPYETFTLGYCIQQIAWHILKKQRVPDTYTELKSMEGSMNRLEKEIQEVQSYHYANYRHYYNPGCQTPVKVEKGVFQWYIGGRHFTITVAETTKAELEAEEKERVKQLKAAQKANNVR